MGASEYRCLHERYVRSLMCIHMRERNPDFVSARARASRRREASALVFVRRSAGEVVRETCCSSWCLFVSIASILCFFFRSTVGDDFVGFK